LSNMAPPAVNSAGSRFMPVLNIGGCWGGDRGTTKFGGGGGDV
jgi:hypothetical protein